MSTKQQVMIELFGTDDHPICDYPECIMCSVRDCPHNEPLHYHHDGCPACDYDSPTYVTKLNSQNQSHSQFANLTDK